MHCGKEGHTALRAAILKCPVPSPEETASSSSPPKLRTKRRQWLVATLLTRNLAEREGFEPRKVALNLISSQADSSAQSAAYYLLDPQIKLISHLSAGCATANCGHWNDAWACVRSRSASAGGVSIAAALALFARQLIFGH